MWQDLTLSDKARMIQLAVNSGITDLATIQQVYNTFAGGGNLGGSDSNEEEPTERRKVGDHYLTLEQYKEQQRDTIRQAAIQKALTRTRGVAPIINGEPGSSCIYTFTDNYGRKYQVAGTQTFAANPEKYGFEVAGPVTEGMEGNMYLQLDKRGVPYHATMITGYTDNGEPLLTYSSGHAGGATPISRERWNSDNQTGQTYEQYLEAFNRYSSPEADYHKNSRAWSSPQYETYRFIGTPDDNTRWQSEWMAGRQVPLVLEMPEVLNNQVALFKDGGKIHIKKENRGKFTALKKRTGHSASWFKAHGTPAQKKMATFALNARKWKHSDGGLMTKL